MNKYLEQIKSFLWVVNRSSGLKFEYLKRNFKKYILYSILAFFFAWISIGWLILEKEQIKVTNLGNKIKTEQGVSIKSPQTTSDVFYVYTDTIAYNIVDNAFYLRFNAADDYGQLIIGNCYNIWSIGIRVGFLDMFENIIYFEEIECIL